jgi:rRNA maturation endonuclease Nob1
MLMCRECGRTYPVAEGFCPKVGTPLADTATV